MRTLLLVTLSSLLFVSCQNEVGRYQAIPFELQSHDRWEPKYGVLDTKTGITYEFNGGIIRKYDMTTGEFESIEMKDITSIKNTLQK
jgi:hypothetical protein